MSRVLSRRAAHALTLHNIAIRPLIANPALCRVRVVGFFNQRHQPVQTKHHGQIRQTEHEKLDAQREHSLEPSATEIAEKEQP